jgi:type IV pilus assembly protein PilP
MRTVLIAALVCGSAASALAQAAPAASASASAQPAAPAAAQAKPLAAPEAAAETYTYDPAGRRDPFLNLLGTGADVRVARRGDGPASMSVAEISVRGVLQSRGALIAMIQGPDTKTYIVHQGDKFIDGTIKNITPQGLIVLQEVNDPLSLVKQREVRKMLRSNEGAKE